MQYVSMRLDAHHIVEDVWYQNKKFASDFDKVFGWKSANDMDCIALHYEWHIRSGEELGNLGYLGAENQTSLTKALQDFLANAQLGPNGEAKPFTKLSELFQAHANFYQQYSKPLWQKLQPWFNQALAKIAAAGL
jgi:hypothetical protein